MLAVAIEKVQDERVKGPKYVHNRNANMQQKMSQMILETPRHPLIDIKTLKTEKNIDKKHKPNINLAIDKVGIT